MPRLAPSIVLAGLMALLALSAQAVVVSGTVLGESGAPVANVNLDFIDATGTSIPLVGDTTDLLGLYSINVPAGTYSIYYKAPFGSGWAHRRVTGVVITTNVTRPDVILPYGFIVDGFVTDSAGAPIANLDLDFNDCATGEQLLTLSDNTDLLGYYSVVVPIGTWSISYDPPVGDTHVGVVVPCVPITGTTTRPTVILQDGFLVSATVRDMRGAPVFDANTSWSDLAGVRVHTSNDRSDAAGLFAVRVVAGSYDITVRPPTGSRLVGTVVPSGPITADTVLPDIILVDGFFVDGFVVTTSGAPLAAIDTDWNLPSGPVTTGEDNSDALGHYGVLVPAGTYSIDFDPPIGNRYCAANLSNTVIDRDRTLPNVVLEAAWFITGRVVDGSITPVFDVDSLSVNVGSGLVQRTILDHSDALGEFTIMLPDGTFDITFTPPVATGLPTKTVQGVVVSGADMRLPDVVLDNLPPPPPDPALIFVTKEGADVVLRWAESPDATRVVSASQQPNVFGATEVLDANVTTLTYRHAGEISVDRLLFYQVR